LIEAARELAENLLRDDLPAAERHCALAGRTRGIAQVLSLRRASTRLHPKCRKFAPSATCPSSSNLFFKLESAWRCVIIDGFSEYTKYKETIVKLHAKVTLFFIGIAVGLLAVLVAISLYAFRSFSIATATEHIRTAGEIVRVHLTESMINGVIDKRERFLQRLVEVQSLKSARVIRSPEVTKQFGSGLSSETAADDMEKTVLLDGKARFEALDIDGDTVFRGTIPYIATSLGNPNCLQCHQVPEGTVLGAVSDHVVECGQGRALLTVTEITAAVTLFALLLILLLRRQLKPISDTARAVEEAVQRALRGDFKAHVEKKTNDEIGQIATDMNRLLTFLDEGLTRIGSNVARLINRAPTPGENLLTVTIDMVDGLTKAAHFKQAIEEDESKEENYERLSTTLKGEFGLGEYSFTRSTNKRQMQSVMVDGETGENCRLRSAGTGSSGPAASHGRSRR
jgi:hypothetical protein